LAASAAGVVVVGAELVVVGALEVVTGAVVEGALVVVVAVGVFSPQATINRLISDIRAISTNNVFLAISLLLNN